MAPNVSLVNVGAVAITGTWAAVTGAIALQTSLQKPAENATLGQGEIGSERVYPVSSPIVSV